MLLLLTIFIIYPQKNSIGRSKEFVLKLKLLPGLAFALTVDIIDAFQTFYGENMLAKDYQPLVNYFKDWTGAKTSTSSLTTIFLRYMKLLRDCGRYGRRTTKYEQFYDRMASSVLHQVWADHPNRWTLVRPIQRE